MQHLARPFIFALLALWLSSCQGHGRVHEAPPPSYPEPSSARPELPAPSRPTAEEGPRDDRFEGEDSYAEPPAVSLGAADGWAPRAPEAQARGEAKAAPEASGALPGWSSPARSRRAPSSSDRPSIRERPSARERHREQRPGLATHWGENRYSPARQVDFERADATRPTAVVELHYNDRAGALEMLPGGAFGSSQVSAMGGSLRISMVDASGRPFPALRQGSRVVSMGDPGERYSLLIENDSGRRFEIVASVDGLDVLDGEDGNVQKRGYLIGAYSSASIDGFRRSDAEVAAFRLGNVARSYAASKGKARNVGVIGFALFDERAPAAYYPPRYRQPFPSDDTYQRRTAEPFPGSYAQPPAW